jgi:hypothetical protein
MSGLSPTPVVLVQGPEGQSLANSGHSGTRFPMYLGTMLC